MSFSFLLKIAKLYYLIVKKKVIRIIVTKEGSIFDCIQPLITPNKEPTIRSVSLRKLLR